MRLMSYDRAAALLSLCGCGETGRHARFRLRYVIGIIKQSILCKKSTKFNIAPVVKLADTIDLGSISERSAGSIPVRCTITNAAFVIIQKMLHYFISLTFVSKINLYTKCLYVLETVKR